MGTAIMATWTDIATEILRLKETGKAGIRVGCLRPLKGWQHLQKRTQTRTRGIGEIEGYKRVTERYKTSQDGAKCFSRRVTRRTLPMFYHREMQS